MALNGLDRIYTIAVKIKKIATNIDAIRVNVLFLFSSFFID